MGVGNLALIVKRLLACGKPKDTPIALIRWGTTAKQKTITGKLSNIVELSRKNNMFPPSIIVVGETVNLRKELSWFEKKPLFAKRIIVTRAREQVSALSDKLIDLGALVVEIPVIKIVSLKADRQLQAAFSKNEYDWIFFTSQNGVGEFAQFLKRQGKDSRIFGKSKICAIGPETTKSLEGIGISPDYVPRRFVAEEIVKHFKGAKTKAGSALVLRAKRARDVLPKGLEDAGFKVKIIDLYDTVIPDESAKLIQEILRRPAAFGGMTPQDDPKIHWVTFTSSSTALNFIKLLGKDYQRKLAGIKLASIGPITSGTLKKLGLEADVEAKVYTIEGLVKAMVKE